MSRPFILVATIRRLLQAAIVGIALLFSTSAGAERWERVTLGPTGDLFEVDRDSVWGGGARRTVSIRVTPGATGPGLVAKVMFRVRLDCEKRLFAPVSAAGFNAAGEQRYYHDVSDSPLKPASSPNTLRIMEIACSASPADARGQDDGSK